MELLKKTIQKICPLDKQAMDEVQKHLDSLTKPRGSLGVLEDLVKQIAGITGKKTFDLKNKVIFTLAGDHGAASSGVSAFPQEVTEQMVYNFLSGGAAINVLARHAGARVIIADFGVRKDLIKNEKLKVKKVNYGTKNFLKEPAMTQKEAILSIEYGISLLEEELQQGIDIAATGEMGIGNTASSSAITAAITKSKVEDVTGKGTGLDDDGLARKCRLIEQALRLHKPDCGSPLDVLAKVGGFEIGGLTGIILAAASHRIPVLIDGFISGAAALIAYSVEPKVKHCMIASHCSVERGHRIILEYIGLKPVLNLNLRLGEGTGAALAMNIVEAAVKIFNEMATFKSASVSDKDSV